MAAMERIVLYKPSNKFPIGNVSLEEATNVVLWGGGMYNCGESAASRFVRTLHLDLQKFIYIPEHHKGGRMVRPLYYKGDRSGTLEFPKLTVCGYYADMGIPSMTKWIVPNLKQLFVFVGDKHNSILLEGMNCWTVHPVENARVQELFRDMPDRTFQECPKLEEINLCAPPDFSNPPPEQFKVLRRLVPPQPLNSECLRVLLIAANKQQDHDSCHIARLPKNVLRHVMSFCHSPSWKQYNYTHDAAATASKEATSRNASEAYMSFSL